MSKVKGQVRLQIGKNGLTKGIINNLKNAFKTRENVKISLLKSFKERKDKEIIGKKIVDNLGENYTFKVVGFTIFIKKWRKSKRLNL